MCSSLLGTLGLAACSLALITSCPPVASKTPTTPPVVTKDPSVTSPPLQLEALVQGTSVHGFTHAAANEARTKVCFMGTGVVTLRSHVT